MRNATQANTATRTAPHRTAQQVSQHLDQLPTARLPDRKAATATRVAAERGRVVRDDCSCGWYERLARTSGGSSFQALPIALATVGEGIVGGAYIV